MGLRHGNGPNYRYSDDAKLDVADEVRGWQVLIEEKTMLEAPDPEQVYKIKKSGERLHRRATLGASKTGVV